MTGLPSHRSPTHRSDTHESPNSISRTENTSFPSLPSVYSLSPLDVLGSVTLQESPSDSRHQYQWEPRDRMISESRSAEISENVLAEYIEFFREKILYCVPVIDDEDLRDERYVIAHKRPLAYCASFVASQFIPGSANVRQQLLAHTLNFIETTRGPLTQDEDILWTQLQALAVLYAYRSAGDLFPLSGAPRPHGFLDHWTLKSSIETFALKAGLHRSIDRLKVLLRKDSSDISKSLTLAMYVYWLWLVTMSHHFSLMTRTPPTLREDSTITLAVGLLRDIPRPSRMTRILAEVDLYTLWQQAGRSAPGLAEWWCTPSDSMSVEAIVAILDDFEGALDVWSKRWGLRGDSNVTISNVDTSKNGAVNFHFQSTRFCISSFGTRYILEKTRCAYDEEFTSRSTLSQLARESVLKSVQAAHACSRCLVDISPLRRETFRYMGDLGYAFVAFCCLYLIQAYELFGATLPMPDSYMTSVEEVANLMTEMAVANNTTPQLYGNSILRQLKRALEGSTAVYRDAQLWTETDNEAIGEPAHPPMEQPPPTPDVDLINVPPPGHYLRHDDAGFQLQANSAFATSPPLFSIFEPSWAHLLR
ncbi:hypothetical protein LTR84_004285 [Exophiala bonariae]|uniref:Transcription factor domain-containing protein n=1 Tax=Exophiala bonariae TaxID=1690606 RepID=A0AAV9N768_9EURO|nr:hypothetical protein LTR84_004285 [Exophiala bonariae]